MQVEAHNMTSTEEAFVHHTAAQGDMNYPSRDNSPTGQFSREPFLDETTPTTDARGSATEAKPSEPSLDGLVERLVSLGSNSFDSLPCMAARELTAIGRAVSFSASKAVQGTKTKLYYTGVVSNVTATTVTLLHVTRYTEEDFEVYKKRERALSRRVAPRASELKGMSAATPTASSALTEGEKASSSLIIHGYSAKGEVGTDAAGHLSAAADPAALLKMDTAGSLARAVATHKPIETEKAAFVEEARAASGPQARAAHHALVSTDAGTVGPFPFITFARRTMHDVKFGRDPRSSFYDLFHDPSNELMDMQYLRMFVRRYLVHTSQGNNTEQVPLFAFVVARSGCPMLDHSFVYHLVREELPDLMKTDRAIESEKKKQKDIEAGGRGSAPRRAEEVPTGIFAATGALYRTRLPHKSFVAGIVLFVFTAVTAIYLGASLGLLKDPFVVSFLLDTLWFVVGAVGVWLFATIATVMHAFFMRVPLRRNMPLLIGRAVLCVCALGGSVMCIAVIIIRMSNTSVYEFMVTQPKEDLCDFYERNQCSGFYDSCNGWWRDRALCRLPCRTYMYDDTTCASVMWTPIQRVLIPLLLFAIVVLFVSFYSLMLTANVIVIGRKVAHRRR